MRAVHCVCAWVVMWGGVVGPARGADPDTRPVGKLTNAELINRLMETTNQEFSVRTNVIRRGRGTAMPRGLLMMQDGDLFPSAVMNELALRGVDALPNLAAHLDDARKTGAAVAAMRSGIWYSAEYDWNPRTAGVRPKGTVIRAGGPGRETVRIAGSVNDREYEVKVGDLCFNIIGRIVNRQFQAVRYQPLAIVIVNSPVLCADLRDAVRNEWGRLTDAQRRASIVGDVTKPANRTQALGALAILARSYPDEIVEAARERLKTPVFDEAKVRNFAMTRLYVTNVADARKTMIEAFVKANGAGYRDGVLLEVWERRNLREGEKMVGGPGSESIPLPTVAPVEVLKQLLPDYDPENPPAVTAVEGRDTGGFIEAIGEMSKPELDELIWEAYRKYSTSRSPAWESDTDGIAMSCIRVMMRRGHGHDEEFLSYLRRRKGEMPPRDPGDQGPDFNGAFQSFIDALTGEGAGK